MRTRAEHRFLRIVADALERLGMPRDTIVLVALSGGPDSVALLHALLTLGERFGYRVAAAHLNHRIRGAESDRDEAFVRDLCARAGVDLTVEHADDLAAEISNLEERARDARYSFLNRVADHVGAQHIALAHHSDDQAETVMLRLLRGAGAAGLGSMDAKGPGRIIRPMLSATRADALAYLGAIGAHFVADSSNESASILRNRIRNHLIPMLERDYAAGLRRRLAELSSEMRSLDDFIADTACSELESMRSGDALDIARFAAIHPALQAAIVREFLRGQLGNLRRIARVHIDAVRELCLAGPPNGVLKLPGKVRVLREYDRLRLSRVDEKGTRFSVMLQPQGTTEVPEAGFVFNSVIVPAGSISAPQSRFEALFDAREAERGLMVRNFARGDQVLPIGMSGHRKIKDVLIDAKVPRLKRSSFPIVELKGAIAWLPGIVRGRVALVSEATHSVLKIGASAIPR